MKNGLDSTEENAGEEQANRRETKGGQRGAANSDGEEVVTDFRHLEEWGFLENRIGSRL